MEKGEITSVLFHLLESRKLEKEKYSWSNKGDGKQTTNVSPKNSFVAVSNPLCELPAPVVTPWPVGASGPVWWPANVHASSARVPPPGGHAPQQRHAPLPDRRGNHRLLLLLLRQRLGLGVEHHLFPQRGGWAWRRLPRRCRRRSRCRHLQRQQRQGRHAPAVAALLPQQAPTVMLTETRVYICLRELRRRMSCFHLSWRRSGSRYGRQMDLETLRVVEVFGEGSPD